LSRHNLNLEIITMTDDKIALRDLLEKGSDATMLREMIGFAAQRLMELEAESLCGAGHGERSPERVNGYRGSRHRTGRIARFAARTQNIGARLRCPT
jgi:transposase-like protein